MGISNTFAEYAQNAAEIKALEARIKEYDLKQDQLRPYIIASMIEQGMKTMDLDIGKFTVGKTKKWIYPEAVIDLGEEFKAAKATAESNGEAMLEETDKLTYTPVKL